MKKTIILALAALLLVFTQCKKDKNTTADNTVRITLNVDGDGSRVNVNTATGEVKFEENDIIYVACHGEYLGTLSYDGSQFDGEITEPTTEDYLYFYFFGKKAPQFSTVENTTTLTVNIADQTNGQHPVISCGTSNVPYSSSINSYSSKLLNKCALVELDITSNFDGDVILYGLNNQVSVDLSNNAFTYSQVNPGAIRISGDQGTNFTRWAILLPQTTLPNTRSAFATGETRAKGNYNFPTGVSEIKANDFIHGENNKVSVSITSELEYTFVDLGLSVEWATCNLGANSPEEYGDYYAWGEIEPYYADGYRLENPITHWRTMTTGGGITSVSSGYCNSSYNGSRPFNEWQNPPYYQDENNDSCFLKRIEQTTTVESSRDIADRISNGNWRMPSYNEFYELWKKCEYNWKYESDGTAGVELTGPNGNTIFLPAAGNYSDNKFLQETTHCCYWTNTLYLSGETNPTASCTDFFVQSGTIKMNLTNKNRCLGYTIRPVKPKSSNQ